MTLSAARRRANTRYNFEGNTIDESGGSWYVVSENGTRVAGPFASAAYAETVLDRVDWPTDLRLNYEI